MVPQDRLKGVIQDSSSSLRQNSGGIERSVLFTMVNGEELVYVNWDMRSDREFLFDLNSSQKTVKYTVPNKDAKLGCSNVLQDDSVVMGSITLYQVMANYNCKKCGLSSFETVYEHAKEVSCVKDFKVKVRNPCIAESEIGIPNNFMFVVQQVTLGRLPMLNVIKIVVGAEHTVGGDVFYGSGWGRYGYMSFMIWTHQNQSDGYDIWMVLRLDVTTDEILRYDPNILTSSRS
ncbi:putative UDP-glucose 4-epimerase [Helianthus anomalus]